MAARRPAPPPPTMSTSQECRSMTLAHLLRYLSSQRSFPPSEVCAELASRRATTKGQTSPPATGGGQRKEGLSEGPSQGTSIPPRDRTVTSWKRRQYVRARGILSIPFPAPAARS